MGRIPRIEDDPEYLGQKEIRGLDNSRGGVLYISYPVFSNEQKNVAATKGLSKEIRQRVHTEKFVEKTNGDSV